MGEFQHTYSGGETQCTHCRGWTRGANLVTECPTRLRAEVERLRLDRADIEHAYNFARDKAKLLERQAVVAWLFRNHYDDTAERIERGEHRREGDDT